MTTPTAAKRPVSSATPRTVRLADDLQPSSSSTDVRAKSAARVPLMPEPLNLSQSAWILLDLLQHQLGVTLEVLDSSMRPLAAIGGSEPTRAVDQPTVAAEVARSMKTGDVRVDRSTGVPVGIFPLRVSRQVVGCLLVSPPPTRVAGADASQDPTEGAGHIARTALESELALTNQLTDARYRARRVHGILRFLQQLGADADSERDVMNAVIQAATVWFDAECRIYQRQPDGSYVVAATLPGADTPNSASRIEAMRAEKLIASRRFPSAGDLEELGLAGRRDEVLVLPVGTTEPAWILILAGNIDQEIELTFTAIARVLAGVLQARDAARTEIWQQRLVAVSDDSRRAPERVLLRLLEALASEVGATSARVTLMTRGAERALAALGQRSGPPAEPPPPGASPDDVSQHLQLAADTSIRVTLTPPADARRLAAVELARWTKALHSWLREMALGAAPVSPFDAAGEISPFETRIQEEVERARRFNLGLGLVLIGAERDPAGDVAVETLLAAIKPELRASDLLGRVRAGLGAVLLVHSEPVGADIVMGRLRQRLEALAADAPVSVVQLGKAMFPADSASADTLIAQALRQAQSVILRN